MKNLHKYILAGAAVLLLFMVILGGRYFANIDSTEYSIKKIVQVVRDDLSLSLIERGLLHPAKVEQIKSLISSNQAQLVWSIDEGETVGKGQIIARFDTKPFIDKMEQAEQKLADVMATLDVAEKNLSVKKVENKGRIEAALRKLDIARIKADDLLNGSGQLQRQQLERKVEQELRTLKIAQQEVTDMEILLAKGHISRREYEQANNTALAAQDNYQLAQAELQNFDHYSWPCMTKEATLMIEAAEKDLSQAKQTSELELQRAQGEIVKLKRDKGRAESRLDRTMADVAACDLRAPINGILLYKELPRADGQHKVQIGDTIWQGQTFMEIPDTSGMIVEIFVREIDVAKLKKGLRAAIELDALPGKRFQGQVELIHSLATEEDNAPGVRTFRTVIRLDGISSEIHAGMSANVHIIYQQHKNVLVVPVEALIYQGGNPSVLKTKNNVETITPVTLGAIGEKNAQILSGLNEGDDISINEVYR